MKEQYEDTFFAKWLNNELDKKTLNEFEKTNEFKELSQIVKTVDTAVMPNYDTEKNLIATLHKIQQQKNTTTTTKTTKVKRLIPSWAYAVASCIVVAVGYLFFYQQTTYTTQLAEKLKIELPDGSFAHLNADSEISYKTFNWKNNKVINLKGEAFFNVKKGKTFSVKTKQGTVTVLGTTFTVKDRENEYNVECYQGKVAVVTAKDDIKLTKGDGYSLKNKTSKTYQTKQKEPSFIHNESVFTATDIKEVVAELERQYNIKVKGKEYLKSAKFSGRFTHSDINKAVKTVFTAMQIPYSVDKKRNIIIKKH